MIALDVLESNFFATKESGILWHTVSTQPVIPAQRSLYFSVCYKFPGPGGQYHNPRQVFGD